jgi:hypothetical protein
MAASLLGIACFILYGKWHWDLFMMGQASVDPELLSWPLIDGLKSASMGFALVGLLLAVVHRHKENEISFYVFAIGLGILACLSIPIVT